MDETIQSSTEWHQYNYHQEPIDELENPFERQLPDEYFMDPGFVGVSRFANETSFCPSTSDTTAALPKENYTAYPPGSSPIRGKGKPGSRRSRASRRTPTTLLNANIRNFRALVQQYTGCQSSSSSIQNEKGPINLSFGSSYQQVDCFGEIPTLEGRYYEGKAGSQEGDQHYHQQNFKGYEVKDRWFSEDKGR